MMATTLAYRDDTEGARVRYADLRDRYERDHGALAAAERVHARRAGRIAAGRTGIAAAVVLAGAAILECTAHARFESGILTAILLGAWPIMGLAYAAGRLTVGRSTAIDSADPPARELHTLIARLERRVPFADARERADLLEQRSLALPLAAIALLGPLTLHALVYAPLSHGQIDHFDRWIALSLAIVGHAHIVLAVLAGRFAKHVREADPRETHRAITRHAWRALGFTVLTSAIPGALLYLIPPFLTALTGLVLVFVLKALAHGVVRERAVLAR